MKRLTTLEMEIAIFAWADIRRKTVVHGVRWGAMPHECDVLILSKAGYATEVEIKVSKQDILAEKKKKHNHESNKVKYFYFAVPERLVEFALENIPERAGLLSVRNMKNVRVVRKPKKNKKCRKWTKQEICGLRRLGTMRIMNLKYNILKLTNKVKRLEKAWENKQ